MAHGGKERIIKCADCGSDYQTSRSNTRYCFVCRMVRDVMFAKGMTRECWACSKRFASLSSYKELCADCDHFKRGAHVTGHCGFCDQDSDRLLHEDVRVCVGCALDPAKRKDLLKSLLRKQAQRTQNPVHLALPDPKSTRREPEEEDRTVVL